jgi:hypothetical protein
MTLHPSEGRAGNPYGYLEVVEQHQQLAALRDSWGNPGIPKNSEQKNRLCRRGKQSTLPTSAQPRRRRRDEETIVKMGGGEAPVHC